MLVFPSGRRRRGEMRIICKYREWIFLIISCCDISMEVNLSNRSRHINDRDGIRKEKIDDYIHLLPMDGRRGRNKSAYHQILSLSLSLARSAPNRQQTYQSTNFFSSWEERQLNEGVNLLMHRQLDLYSPRRRRHQWNCHCRWYTSRKLGEMPNCGRPFFSPDDFI